MRVLKKDLRTGIVKLATESLDDLWYLSHLINAGDVIRSKTQRRIKDGDDRRSKGGQRKTITVSLTVENVSFDPKKGVLRLSGLISHGPEDLVTLGSHHTVNVDCDFTLLISKNRFERSELEILDEAVKATLRPKVIIVSVDDSEAAVGIVRESATDIFELSSNIGGKYDTTLRQSRIDEFHKNISDVVKNMVQQNNISSILICGPGFSKNAFFETLKKLCPKTASIASVRDTGQSGRAGINEVLKGKDVHKALEMVASANNARLVEGILEHIGKDTGLATYGIDHVEKAALSGACENVLVTDELFLEKRGRIEAIFGAVKSGRGKISIVNVSEPAGQMLHSLGGLAAKLRYAI